MSRWGSIFRIAVAGVYAFYSGNWAQFAVQVESERQRRARDKQNQRARQAFNEAQKDRLEMVDLLPDAPRSLVLGRVRYVEGVRRRWSSGDNAEKLTMIVSYAGHEIDAFESWYIDDIPVTIDGSGYVEPTSIGTGEGYTTTAAGFAVGTTSLPLITGTGTIETGDLVLVDGDPTYYTTATGITAPGTLVIASPGLLKAIPASAKAVTLVRAPWSKTTFEPGNNVDVLDGAGAGTITLSFTPRTGSVTAQWSLGSGETYQTGACTVDSVSGVTVNVSGGQPGAAVTVNYTRTLASAYVRIRPYLGTDAQNVGDDLDGEFPGKISSTDKFAGIALAAVDLTYSPDVFPQGPPNVTAVMRGAKAYDPRLDNAVAPYRMLVKQNRIAVTPPNNGNTYSGWPVALRLFNGDILVGYTSGPSHHLAATPIGVIKRSTDNGATWSTEITVYDHPSKGVNLYGLGQSTTGRVFASMWIDNTPSAGGAKALISYSDDDGATWSTPQDVTSTCGFTDQGEATGPVIVAPSGVLLMSCDGIDSGGAFVTDARTVVLKSTDDGATWGSPVLVASPALYPGRIYTESFLLRVGFKVLCLMRTAVSPGYIYISTSEDSGATWSAPVQGPAMVSVPNTVVMENGDLVMAGRLDATDGQGVIYTSHDQGLTWSQSILDDAGYDIPYAAPVDRLDGSALILYSYEVTSGSTADVRAAIALPVSTSFSPWGTLGSNVSILDSTTAFISNGGGSGRSGTSRTGSGYYYGRLTPLHGSDVQVVGFVNGSFGLTSYPGASAGSWGVALSDGKKYLAGAAGASFTSPIPAGKPLGLAWHNGTLELWDHTAQTKIGDFATSITGPVYIAWGPGTSGSTGGPWACNFYPGNDGFLPPGASAWGDESNSIDDPTTWAWTENPALLALRYAMWPSGFNLSAAQISDTTKEDVSLAADWCDQSTEFTLVDPDSTVTMVRHRCGATIPADADKRQAMDSIVDTMAGEWAFDGPDLRIRAGMMRDAVFAIDQTWLVEEVKSGDDSGDAWAEGVQSISREQRINRVIGKCIDPNQRYQMLPYPAVSDAVLIAAKGEKREEIDYPNVNHVAHAQHLASIEIRRRQAGQVLTLLCDSRAEHLQLFDRGTFTLPDYDIDAKPYEVIGVDIPMTGAPKIMLREISDEIFTVDAELSGVDPAPDTSLRKPWDMDTLGALTITSGTTELLDASIVARALVTWPAVTDERIRNGGSIEIQFTRADEALPDGEWESRVEPGNSTTMTITGLLTGRPYLIRGRVVQRMPLVRGPWTDIVHHTMAVLVSVPSAVGGGNLLRNSSFEVDSDADGLSDYWTAYSAGTTGSVTYSRVSGGVSGGYYQRISASGLGTSSSDQAGVYGVVELVGFAGLPICFTPFVRGLGGGAGGVAVRLHVDYYDAAGGTGSTVGSDSLTVVSTDTSATDFLRYTMPGRVPTDALSARVYVWMQSRGTSSGAAHIDIDALQFEPGANPTGYSAKADELLAGVVTTANLITNAATVVSSDAPSAGSQSYTRSGSPGYSNAKVVSESSWANATGETVRVELTSAAQWRKQAGSVGSLRGYAQYRIGGSLNGYDVVAGDGDRFAGHTLISDTSEWIEHARAMTVDVADGTTIYFACYFLMLPSSVSDTVVGEWLTASTRITATLR